jgi:hypothetical protein
MRCALEEAMTEPSDEQISQWAEEVSGSLPLGHTEWEFEETFARRVWREAQKDVGEPGFFGRAAARLGFSLPRGGSQRTSGRPEVRLFRTRHDCRAFIEERYGYIRTRSDLRREPHGWMVPRAVRVEVRRVKP